MHPAPVTAELAAALVVGLPPGGWQVGVAEDVAALVDQQRVAGGGLTRAFGPQQADEVEVQLQGG